MKRGALFLDRDDTIIHDDGYMGRPEQIRLLPGVAVALRQAAARFRLYLVTNQSGIGRGLYSMADAEACNNRLADLLDLPEPGFAGICIAPEKPGDPSQYRKPSPAFLLEMIARDDLDAETCCIIGDKTSDLDCGLNAGIRAILVGKGEGEPRADALLFAHKHGLSVFKSLPEALEAILESSPGNYSKA